MCVENFLPDSKFKFDQNIPKIMSLMLYVSKHYNNLGTGASHNWHSLK